MKGLTNFILAFLFINLSCDRLVESPPPLGSTFYYNSFETETELNGWQGISVYNLYADAPLNGGTKSIYISGGCEYPHAWYTFDSPARNIDLTLDFYGKFLSHGGMVELQIGSDHRNTTVIGVTESTWQHYESNEIISWPADSTLTIMLNSGGFVPGSMLIDCLRLAEID